MTTDDLLAKLRESLITLGTDGVYAFVCVQVPFLGWPGIRALTKFIIEKCVRFLITETELAVYFTLSDAATEKQAEDFKSAAGALEAAKARGATPEEITAHEKELIEAARRLIKLGHM